MPKVLWIIATLPNKVTKQNSRNPIFRTQIWKKKCIVHSCIQMNAKHILNLVKPYNRTSCNIQLTQVSIMQLSEMAFYKTENYGFNNNCTISKTSIGNQYYKCIRTSTIPLSTIRLWVEISLCFINGVGMNLLFNEKLNALLCLLACMGTVVMDWDFFENFIRFYYFVISADPFFGLLARPHFNIHWQKWFCFFNNQLQIGSKLFR